MKHKIVLVISALLLSVSLKAQLTYSSDLATNIFTTMRADAPFVNTTLLNVGSLISFGYGTLTFNLIPNFDPTSPSDLQVGPGFGMSVNEVSSFHADNDNFGARRGIGVDDQLLYGNIGPASNLTWHINAAVLSDVDFYAQDLTVSGATKFSMNDVLSWRTFTATDGLFNYHMLFNDDRRALLGSDHDYNDFGIGLIQSVEPVGLESVPESSTYGLIGGAVLLGMVALRRIKRQSSAIA
jgi:hypothetical protein